MSYPWHSSRRGLLAVFLIGAFCSLAWTGDKSKESSGEEVKFTSRADLVLVPVIVNDKSGAHVPGLKKEDFSVRENGAEQKIAVFEEVTTEPRRLQYASKPNVFSNSLSAGPSARRVTLILLDFINTAFADQARERQALVKYLSESLDRREPVALFYLTRSGLTVVHDFTTDPQMLLAALHKLRGEAYQLVDTPEDVEALTGTASPDGSNGMVTPTTAASQVDAEMSRLQTMLEDSELNFQSFQQRLAITCTLQAMQQLAQGVSGFPGRKSLIWASGGFPFSVSDNTMSLAPAGRDSLSDVLPLYERTWQLLNDAQVSLYPVDVKGVNVTTMPTASIGRPGANYARNMMWRQSDTQATFQTFASMTGGRAYYNSNDLIRGFRDAVRDSSSYYMLGYYLDHSNTKPGWRRLTVKANGEH